MARKIELKSGKGKKFRKMVIIIGTIFVFLITSRIIFNEPRKQNETKIGEEVSQNGRVVQLVTQDYYSSNRVLAISFKAKKSGVQDYSELKLDVKKSRSQSESFPVEIQKITSDYYVAFVSGLPKKWKTLLVEVGDKNEESMLSGSADKITISNETVPTHEAYKKHNAYYFEKKYLEFSLRETNKIIKKNQKNIATIKDKIKRVNENTRVLKEDIWSQTDSEKEQTESMITSNQSTVEASEKEIATIEESEKEMNEKATKLDKRIKEISSKVE